MEDTDKLGNVTLIPVAPKHQRQGYGSRFMTEGIEPFLKRSKGKTSLLINSQGNVYFYKNGYKEVYSSEINQVEMGSWYLKTLRIQP